MRTNFTVEDVYRYWESLSKEVFGYFGYKHTVARPWPKFRVEQYNSYWVSTAALTYYTDPKLLFGQTLDHSPLVTFNSHWAPFMYEDELIGCLIHEAAHVVAGYYAAHGPEWSSLAAEVGGHSEPHFHLRKHLEFCDAFGLEQNTPWKPSYTEPV